jgi:hypothetical protein
MALVGAMVKRKMVKKIQMMSPKMMKEALKDNPRKISCVQLRKAQNHIPHTTSL